MNAETMKPLSDALAERIKSKTDDDIRARLRAARAAAFAAYQAALSPLFGQQFGVVVDAALSDAETGIAFAVLPLAERQAFQTVVERLTAETV